jgi:hypothetical protein
VEIAEDDLQDVHTVPFRLVKDKITVRAKVNGGSAQDFVSTPAPKKPVISAQTAQRAGVRPITYTLSAGVGEVGLRGLQLARLDSFELGTLQVRNLPVLIKNPALRGIPKREGESFSPLSLGMSITIDYQQKLLTIARHLPEGHADFRLPMRIARLGAGARPPQLQESGLLRRRHRRRGDFRSAATQLTRWRNHRSGGSPCASTGRRGGTAMPSSFRASISTSIASNTAITRSSS